MNETWKDVVGYEGIYQVSDMGRVRRVKGDKGTLLGKILKPHLRGTITKYPAVMLYQGSSETRKRFFVHILVAMAFLGPIPEGYEVNHKNGDKTNPRLDNLEYMTHSENFIHALTVLGVGPDNSGSRNGQAVLHESDVLKIRELYATEQFYQRELAAQFGVSQSVITDIVNFRKWKHVGGPQSAVTYRPLKPTRPGNAKLDPDKVRQIRSLAAAKQHSYKQLGRMFGVSDTLISYVVKGLIWTDIM